MSQENSLLYGNTSGFSLVGIMVVGALIPIIGLAVMEMATQSVRMKVNSESDFEISSKLHIIKESLSVSEICKKVTAFQGKILTADSRDFFDAQGKGKDFNLVVQDGAAQRGLAAVGDSPSPTRWKFTGIHLKDLSPLSARYTLAKLELATDKEAARFIGSGKTSTDLDMWFEVDPTNQIIKNCGAGGKGDVPENKTCPVGSQLVGTSKRNNTMLCGFTGSALLSEGDEPTLPPEIMEPEICFHNRNSGSNEQMKDCQNSNGNCVFESGKWHFENDGGGGQRNCEYGMKVSTPPAGSYLLDASEPTDSDTTKPLNCLIKIEDQVRYDGAPKCDPPVTSPPRSTLYRTCSYDQTNQKWMMSATRYDGLGRAIRSTSRECTGGVVVKPTG